ncbi:sugar phosphate isomerase/epimerase family protein [Paenarthrobacter sp. NPDC092416]|uniref:sugar phosphate isomerase/epimerase family protein n=1 Tax=Paenarthrobacter sp. NPDC092416 TaxID=3364386 RepID=UPI0037F49FF5
MRIGVDGRKIPEAKKLGPVESFTHAHGMGMEGLFFRTILDVSPTLDAGYIREVRDKADALDMYFEAGLGKVNPYVMAEAPELRAIGNGDTLLGFRRMMEACAAVEVRELWVSTANYKPQFFGRLAYDRFRTDVSWQDQLEATQKFMQKLAPIARHLGLHLNMETHEEITSFEILRMIEAVGEDVMGVVFDTGNVLQRAEHPVWAAKRVAPFTRQTHIKDAYVAFSPNGLAYQSRECGQGVIDFGEIVPILHVENPELNLSIENNYSLSDQPLVYLNDIEIFDKEWLAAHPDLSVAELAEFIELINDYKGRIERQEVTDFQTYADAPFQYDETVQWIKTSAEHLRSVCSANGIPVNQPTAHAQ